MSLFSIILISIVITTIIYLAIWRIVIAKFRAKVLDIVYYYDWVRIDREVERFIFPVQEDGICNGIIIKGRDGEDVKLSITTLSILNIIKQNQPLFEFYRVDESRYDCIPTEGFSVEASRLKESVIKTTNRLHKQYERFPVYVQGQLYGANNVLMDIKQQFEEQ